MNLFRQQVFQGIMKRFFFHLIALIILLSMPISVSAQTAIDMDSDMSNTDHDAQGFDDCELNKDEINVPAQYYAEITLRDAEEINLKTGSYHLKFLLELCSNDINFAKEGVPIIEFVNADIEKNDYRNEKIDDNYYSVEIEGEFFEEMNFRYYPYGGVGLLIELEIEDKGIDEVIFLKKVDGNPNSDGKYIPGWVLNDWESDVQIVEKDGTERSRFLMTYYIDKPFLSNFLLSFFPVFVIVGIVMFNFYMDPYDGMGHKAALGSMLTLVFLQVGFLSGEIPPLDYLTLQDKFMTVSYLIISYPILGNFLQRKYNIRDDLEAKIKLNRKMLKILPVLIVLTFVFLSGIDLVI